MQKTRVPGSDKNLSKIALGCSRFGSFNSPLSTADVRSLLAAAFDAGVTTFDTSDVYGQGDSERELGRFLNGSRMAESFILTKGGKLFSNKMRLLRPFKPILKPLLSQKGKSAVTARRSDEISSNFSPTHIISAVEGSLRRLRTDVLDGYVLHSPPLADATRPALWEALAKLKREGKIAAFGISCDTREVLEASLPMPGLTLLELPYDVLVEIQGSATATQIIQRKMIVFAREIIRLQPGTPAEIAVRNAVNMPLVSSTIIGTSKINHLRAVLNSANSALTELRA